MTRRDQELLFRSTVAATVSISVAMLVVLLIGIWGAQRDLSDIRANLLRAEVGRLHSHGLRTVARLETELEPDGSAADLTEIHSFDWLQTFWKRVIPAEQQRLYAAIVKPDGEIVMHSQKQMAGRKPDADWQQAPVPVTVEMGHVCQTSDPFLTAGLPAIDISLPIEVNGILVGHYHSGFDQAWLEKQTVALQRPVRNRWILLVGTIFVIVLVAALSLHRINRRTAALQQAISISHVKQLSDLGRLVGALAHEIRNPLNAIRLNLHALQNVLLDKATLSPEEIQLAVEESNREILRLSELMKTMLGYARPEQAAAEEIDLNQEISATGSFLTQMMQRNQIRFTVSVPEIPTIVSMDPDRLRQVLLNLSNNALDAAGPGGEVRLSLQTGDRFATICIEDDGPGIPPAERENIFEAFYSTRDTGTGLGLALVRRFVEEAGGTVRCTQNGPNSHLSGAVFEISLPLINQPDDASSSPR
ncbi:MAG: HAMP domain-containing sensor histidine kinase [Fuerstiella sp.]